MAYIRSFWQIISSRLCIGFHLFDKYPIYYPSESHVHNLCLFPPSSVVRKMEFCLERHLSVVTSGETNTIIHFVIITHYTKSRNYTDFYDYCYRIKICWQLSDNILFDKFRNCKNNERKKLMASSWISEFSIFQIDILSICTTIDSQEEIPFVFCIRLL